MSKYYSINGKILPKEAANIRVDDLAIVRGYGLFDFFMVKQGKPLFFDDYLDRMELSAKELRLPMQYSRAELKRQIFDLIAANEMEFGSVKLILTGGYSPDGYTIASPNLIMLTVPPVNNPISKYEEGVKLMLHEYHRTFPIVKSINYIVGVKLYPEMKASGAEDILFHFGGYVHETVRANFFIVKSDNTIVTAEEEILKGITRKHTLDVAERNYKVEKRPVKLEEVKTAKEAFITSTTKQVMPVVKIDDLIVGDGRVGEVSKHLLQLFRQKEQGYLAAALY